MNDTNVFLSHYHHHSGALLNADVTSVCNPHGELFAYAFGLVRALPLGLWLALSGLTWITGEWYFFVLSHTYLLSLFILHPILGALVPWTASVPAHPECDSRDYVGPALEALLLYQYLAQALIHNKLLWRLKVKWTAWLWKCALAVGVPWLMHYSGNYSTLQLVQGAIIGSALGAVYMYVLVCWLRPQFWRLNASRFCTERMGMQAARDIGAMYYRWEVDQQRQQQQQQRHFIMTNIGPSASPATAFLSNPKEPRSMHGITHSHMARSIVLF